MTQIMKHTFRISPDWFEVGICPAIQRRTVVGALIIAACIAWWLVTKTWYPIIVALFVVVGRAYEYISIPNTKKMISALHVTTSSTGLEFFGQGIRGGVLYPWSSMSASLRRAPDGSISSITIKDLARKRSKVLLMGYETMNELGTLIEQNAHES